MARRFSRSVKRFRRGKREFIWVRVQAESNPLPNSGAAEEFVFVNGATWGRAGPASGTIQKGCVLIRSIVEWSVCLPPDEAPASAVEGDNGFIGLRRCDQDDTAILTAGTDFFDEEWMHTDWWQAWRTTEAVATLTWADHSGSLFRRGWDSKVKRKLTTEDEIRFAVCRNNANPGVGANPANGTFICAVYGQFLLQLP